jgi:Ca-activated chloride channel family protein
MRFSTPGFFIAFAVVALLLLLWWWSGYRRKRLLSIFADQQLLAGLIRGFSPRRRRYKYLLLFLALVVLVLCLARPQLGTHMVMVKREGQDVMVAIDVSSSMLAEDMKPNRLAKAKQEVMGLLDKLQGDRIGLVAFAGAAFVQCPLTLDYSAARLFLDVIDTDLIPHQGTNLAQAIEKGTGAFVKKERKHKVMILITDGENFGENLDEAVNNAKIEGVRIYAIGIGRPEGEPIPIRNTRGEMVGYKKDENGELIMTRLDEVTLKQIAAATDGKYYHATAGEIELDRIYADISAQEAKEHEGRLLTQYEDRFQYLLPFVIVFLSLEMLVSERRPLRQKELT